MGTVSDVLSWIMTTVPWELLLGFLGGFFVARHYSRAAAIDLQRKAQFLAKVGIFAARTMSTKGTFSVELDVYGLPKSYTLEDQYGSMSVSEDRETGDFYVGERSNPSTRPIE